MTDIAQRLRVQSDTEEVMKAWDTLRAYLLDGKKGSYARDIFESILSTIDEEREEAADHIDALESRIAELEKALEPFAREADTWPDDGAPDDYRVKIKLFLKVLPARFTVGDLRRARSLLQKHKEG